MIVAVFSDIHANQEALGSAVSAAETRGADALVNLGDVVGYGPSPRECVDRVRAEFAVSVLGNHDAAIARDEGVDVLPPDGQVAAEHNRQALRPDQLEWLAGLPYVAEAYGATFVHAAPLEPERWPRLESAGHVRQQFEAFSTPICFVGHSHRPALLSDVLGVFRVRRGHRFIVDVGSVGQPRDRDPRLAFALFDSEVFAVEVVREHYDYAMTTLKVAHEGLPHSLGARLRRGL